MIGWDEYQPGMITVPSFVTPLTGEKFLYDRQLHDRGGAYEPATYSYDRPLVNTYNPNRRETPQLAHRNYNYAALYYYPEISDAVDYISRQLEVPGEWVADTLAATTKGTFHHQRIQPNGSGGLIPYSQSILSDMQVSPKEYYESVPLQAQVIAANMSRFIPQLNGIEHFFTAAVAPQLMEELDKDPLSVARRNNGFRTLHSYWDSLGKYRNVQYDHLLNNFRQDLNKRLVSEHHDSSCAWCLSLANSKSFVPHEYQPL